MLTLSWFELAQRLYTLQCILSVYIYFFIAITKINHPLTSHTEHLFNLQFAAKELQRNSKKCDKEEKEEKAKVKQVGLLNCEFTREQHPGTGKVIVPL